MLVKKITITHCIITQISDLIKKPPQNLLTNIEDKREALLFHIQAI